LLAKLTELPLIELQYLPYKAHTPVTTHGSPIRLLEVVVLELSPTSWKWQVLSRDAEIARGVEYGSQADDFDRRLRVKRCTPFYAWPSAKSASARKLTDSNA
jgi:hypothetical protein